MGHDPSHEPSLVEETSVYGWDNERGHEKTLIYIPAAIKHHEEFPLTKDGGVEVQIDKENDELVIRDLSK